MRIYDWHGSSPRNTAHITGSSTTSSKHAKAEAIRIAAELIARRPETGPLDRWTFTPSLCNNGRKTTHKPKLNPLAPRTRGHRFCKNCGGQRASRAWDGSFMLCNCTPPPH